MTFGEPGKEGARVHDIKDVEAILDTFRAHGHTEVGSRSSLWTLVPQLIYDSCQINTARTYAGGTSEEYLGKIDLLSKGFKIETKLSPKKVWLSPIYFFLCPECAAYFQELAEPISHDAEVGLFFVSYFALNILLSPRDFESIYLYH